MSDVDDELLALAGGDVSSDDEGASMNISREDSRSPSPPPAKKEAPKKGVAQKRGPAPKKARKSAKAHDSDEDEGEA
jgi:RNA polymerase-associated protein RTF1